MDVAVGSILEGVLQIVIAVVATAVGAWLIWRYVDLPFGTPKSARLTYEERVRNESPDRP